MNEDQLLVNSLQNQFLDKALHDPEKSIAYIQYQQIKQDPRLLTLLVTPELLIGVLSAYKTEKLKVQRLEETLTRMKDKR